MGKRPLHSVTHRNFKAAIKSYRDDATPSFCQRSCTRATAERGHATKRRETSARESSTIMEGSPEPAKQGGLEGTTFGTAVVRVQVLRVQDLE